MNILMHYGIKRLIFVFPVLLSTIQTFSQEQQTCAEKLQAAQTFFGRGQVELVSALISPCLESGFNREESLQAYKLMIQTYLFNEKLELADSTMLAFLKKNPEYQVSPTDHSSFVSLYNNFVSKVIIQLSLHIGTNMPFTFILTDRSLSGTPGEKKYSSKVANFFGSLEVKYKLTDRLEINAEPGYSQFSFVRTETINPFSQTNIEEIQRRIELPFTATYDAFRLGKFVSYARLGAGISFNTGSYGIGELSPFDRNNPDRRTGENMKNLQRRFIDLFVQSGAGLKYKIREGFLFAEIRSNFGFLNQSMLTGYSGENLEREFYYMSAEDDFIVNTLNFSVGYTRILYKPVRREE